MAGMKGHLQIRFWGTRGSIATPGPSTVRYGGNTSCVEVRAADGTLIVLDCGTGAHALGQALLTSSQRPLRGHVLISHTHWDHIQGFPFFAPLFVPGNEWDVYAPRGLGRRLEETLAGQMEYAYFPVTLGAMGATLRYHDLTESLFEVGGVRVAARYLNHPALALGYRLEADGVAVVYATDHEPHSRHQLGRPVHEEDRRHIEFLAGADLVIHDAQYTEEEYPAKMTWGHTAAEQAVDFAVAAGARRVALFHHDPLRDDDALDRLLEVCRARAAAAGSGLEVLAAAEGQVVVLERTTALEAVSPPVPPGRAAVATPPLATILIADDDPEVVSVLAETLAPIGFRVFTAADGDTALSVARAERPDLVLLDWNMPGRSGIDVCRALRSDPDPRLRTVPVVLLTVRAEAEETGAAFAAGVTDYVIKPFKFAHIRSRIEAWLLRHRTG
jgi:CheY-like chemotaxis protein/phosphoribosyl 1,2-cyclic phosphodiesterase